MREGGGVALRREVVTEVSVQNLETIALPLVDLPRERGRNE
jgi:hypothetical protein